MKQLRKWFPLGWKLTKCRKWTEMPLNSSRNTHLALFYLPFDNSFKIQSNPWDLKIVVVVDRWSLFRGHFYSNSSNWDLKMLVVSSGLTVVFRTLNCIWKHFRSHFGQDSSPWLLTPYQTLIWIAYRVVSGAVHLGGDDPSDEVDGVVNDAVDLRTTPESVSILNTIAETMAF